MRSLTAPASPGTPAWVAVEGRMHAALGLLRVVLLLNAVGLNLYRLDVFRHPALGVAALVVMTAWTAITVVGYRSPRGRRWPLLVADLVVTVGLLVATPVVKGPGFHATIPGFWVMAALLAWAIHWRWWGGLVAGVVLSLSDVAFRDQVTQSVYGNVFLLVVGGPVVGYLAGSLKDMADARERAQLEVAAAAERARLARAVHDGVLQVLALVQRRGRELGGAAAELGELAGEQERALRTLIHRQDTVEAAPVGAVVAGPSADVDLVARLAALGERPGTHVVLPAGGVRLPAPVAEELLAAVGEALANVERHVGPGAAAWVLLEDEPDRVRVSVRDDGPGIADGRLEQAEREGRMGVAGSIQGRLRDLGGSAVVETGSFGTEWRMEVPR